MTTPSELLEFHRALLDDDERLGTMRRAIEQTVRPGDVVLDIGAGTGVLALFAARAGARRVYAIEPGGIVSLARELCRRNGLQDRIVCIEGPSLDVTLPERANVLITETIGNFGFEEGILGWVTDARQRLLEPDARIVPRAIELHCAPVECPGAYRRCVSWPQAALGFDFSAIPEIAVNNVHWVRFEPGELLAEPVRLGRVELHAASDDPFEGETEHTFTRGGTLHGIAGWFRAELAGDLMLTNMPPAKGSSWQQAFFPIATPLAVEQGDGLRVTIRCALNGAEWRWRVCHRPRPGRRGQTGDSDNGREYATFFGAPLSAAALRTRALGNRPTPNRRGEVMHFVLGAMTGEKSVEQLAVQVRERFPDLYPGLDAATRCVQDVAVKFSRAGDAPD